MHRLKVDETGGHPLELDDFQYIQNGVAGAFAGLLSPYADCLLSGCVVVVNGGNLDVYPGSVSLGGEVLEVVAHSVANTPGETFYWVLQVTFDPDGLENFEDGNQRDTYEVRRAVLTSSATPPAGYFEFDVATLHSDTWMEVVHRPEAWHEVGDPANGLGSTFVAFENATVGDSTLRFRKYKDGRVCLTGFIKRLAFGAESTGEQVCNLPASYGPFGGEVRFQVTGIDTGTENLQAPIQLFVLSTGQVFWSPNTPVLELAGAGAGSTHEPDYLHITVSWPTF